ncbi:MAG: hypothetical protein ACR2MP_04145 [Streptosporangiaceae bacterium]
MSTSMIARAAAAAARTTVTPAEPVENTEVTGQRIAARGGFSHGMTI